MTCLTRGLCVVCVLTALLSGAEFHPAFPLERNSPNPSTDDRATAAALNEEYQSAVKRNDVRTMDRILADDFVLVTGSGKTLSKGGSAQRIGQWRIRLRAPGRHREECTCVGRHSSCDCEVMDEGNGPGE